MPESGTSVPPEVNLWWDGVDIPMFTPDGPEKNRTCFFDTNFLADEPIGRVFAELRVLLEPERGVDFFIHVDDLNLKFFESSSHSDKLSIREVYNVYAALKQNDGVKNPEPLFARLLTMPNHSVRWEKLVKAARKGKGIKDIDFIRNDGEGEKEEEMSAEQPVSMTEEAAENPTDSKAQIKHEHSKSMDEDFELQIYFDDDDELLAADAGLIPSVPPPELKLDIQMKDDVEPQPPVSNAAGGVYDDDLISYSDSEDEDLGSKAPTPAYTAVSSAIPKVTSASPIVNVSSTGPSPSASAISPVNVVSPAASIPPTSMVSPVNTAPPATTISPARMASPVISSPPPATAPVTKAAPPATTTPPARPVPQVISSPPPATAPPVTKAAPPASIIPRATTASPAIGSSPPATAPQVSRTGPSNSTSRRAAVPPALKPSPPSNISPITTSRPSTAASPTNVQFGASFPPATAVSPTNVQFAASFPPMTAGSPVTGAFQAPVSSPYTGPFTFTPGAFMPNSSTMVSTPMFPATSYIMIPAHTAVAGGSPVSLGFPVFFGNPQQDASQPRVQSRSGSFDYSGEYSDPEVPAQRRISYDCSGNSGGNGNRGYAQVDNNEQNFDNAEQDFDNGDEEYNNGEENYGDGDQEYYDDEYYDNGDQEYGNGEEYYDNGAQEYDNGDQEYNNGDQEYNNGESHFDNGGQQFNNDDDLINYDDDEAEDVDNANSTQINATSENKATFKGDDKTNLDLDDDEIVFDYDDESAANIDNSTSNQTAPSSFQGSKRNLTGDVEVPKDVKRARPS